MKANAYTYLTPIGTFAIREHDGSWTLYLNETRLDSAAYVHPQFVVDDLVSNVIELPGDTHGSELGLPDLLHEWARLDGH
jgi:hypothetical protein